MKRAKISPGALSGISIRSRAGSDDRQFVTQAAAERNNACRPHRFLGVGSKLPAVKKECALKLA